MDAVRARAGAWWRRRTHGLPLGRDLLHRLHRWLTYRPERRYMRG